jgi:leucyl/phenylalanyl-tRNA--protein transferase
MARLPWLEINDPFPPVTGAESHDLLADGLLADGLLADGLLAAGADLSPSRLIDAYQRGIFPWYSAGEPILWWSPAPRCVIVPEEFHVSRSLQKRLRTADFHITSNRVFADVVHACDTVDERAYGTWITQDMFDAYCNMHKLGWAHSVEVWRNEELVGGVYGLAIGKVFFGESMFSHETDASKIALLFLCRALVALDFALLDCQVENPHLLSLGAKNISRTQFHTTLQQHAYPALALDMQKLQHAIQHAQL